MHHEIKNEINEKIRQVIEEREKGNQEEQKEEKKTEESQERSYLRNMEKFGVKIMSSSDLEFGDELGSGSYGDVYKGIYKSVPVAIKKIKIKELDDVEDAVDDFFNDLIPWCKIRHHRFVTIYGISYDQGLAIISELCKEDCKKALSRIQQEQNRKLLFRICYELAEALVFMHEIYNLVHRDIKCLNVLLDKNDHVKVCDFGLARNLVARLRTETQQSQKSEQQSSKQVNFDPNELEIEINQYGRLRESTLRFMAPEYFKTKVVLTKSVDTYAYGCTLLQLYSGKLPFQFEEENGKKMSEFEIRSYLSSGIIPVIPPKVPFYIQDIIEGCLRQDPLKRPKMRDIFIKLENTLNNEEEFSNIFLCQSNISSNLSSNPKIIFSKQKSLPISSNQSEFIDLEINSLKVNLSVPAQQFKQEMLGSTQQQYANEVANQNQNQELIWEDEGIENSFNRKQLYANVNHPQPQVQKINFNEMQEYYKQEPYANTQPGLQAP